MLAVNLTATKLSLALLPCPFCGSDDVELSNTWTPAYSVVCQDCLAEVPGAAAEWSGQGEAYDPERHRQSAQSAANAWNHRTAGASPAGSTE